MVMVTLLSIKYFSVTGNSLRKKGCLSVLRGPGPRRIELQVNGKSFCHIHYHQPFVSTASACSPTARWMGLQEGWQGKWIENE